MNNAVLDIAIGLVFIYVLYSLLATTISEFIATIFTYRGKMLERGIEQMLDGTNIKIRWWNRVKNYLLSLISGNRRQNIQLLGVPAFSRLFQQKAKLFSNDVLNHQLYRRAAEKGLSDKPSYLSADTFTNILIDILHDDKTGPILLRNIADKIAVKAQDKNDPFNNELKGILDIYLQQANGDVAHFKRLLEQWYDDMMDRVSGWYRRQANKVLLIIGVFLAVIFNVNTLSVVDTLSKEKVVRDAFVKSAIELVNRGLDTNGHLRAGNANTTGAQNPQIAAEEKSKRKDSLTTSTDTGKRQGKEAATTADSLAANTVKNGANAAGPTGSNRDTSLAVVKAQIARARELYYNDIAQANTTLGLGWGDYGYSIDSIAWVADSLSWAADPQGFRRAHCGKDFNEVHRSGKPAPPDWQNKVRFVFTGILKPRNLLGILITAFAIALGAPFWFDLLNKFINLRVSGAKPEDKTAAKTGKPRTNQPDPAAKG